MIRRNGRAAMGGYTIAAALGLSLSLGLVAAGDAPVPPGPPLDLVGKTSRVLGLRTGKIFRFHQSADIGHRVELELTIDGSTETVEMLPYSVRAADFRVLSQEADGSLHEQAPSGVRTFRGRLRGRPGSFAAGSLREDGLRVRILTAAGGEYWMEPIGRRIAGAGAADHVFYSQNDVISTGNACAAFGEMAVGIVGAADGGGDGAGSGGTAEAGGVLKVAAIACDADFEYFQRWGSVAAVQNRIEEVINAVNVQYERDVAITHLITTILVRASEPDPYTATDPNTLLQEFRSQWSANHGNISRDVAHLFTGKNLDSNVVGIAWIGAVCGSLAYGVSQSDFTSNFAGVTDLTAHELGHNWGANHCSCSGYTMNPSITSGNQFSAASISVITSFRDGLNCLDDSASDIPATPSGLAASAVSDSRIELSWNDVAVNEQGYDVERSADGADWSVTASLGANSSSYSDTGLSALTSYFYRVKAYNSLGDSGYSNTASATTDAPPPSVDQVAATEAFGTGTVNGTFVLTRVDDGQVQSIREQTSGGKKSQRTSRLEHTWQFESVRSGLAVTLFANAWSTESVDGDTFQFEYSTDGTSFVSVFELGVGPQEDGDWHAFSLPSTLSGTVFLRVRDTDRSAGNQSLDTVFVDQLFIRTDLVPGNPPVAPGQLTAVAESSAVIRVDWLDSAVDEYGFEVESSTDGSRWGLVGTAPADATTFMDTTVSPGTAYLYRVRAYNGAGNSAWTGPAAASTPDGILADAVGYKVKGKQRVDLTWSGGSTATIEIYRDGQFLDAVANSGSYTDRIGAKGGGRYDYQICEPATGACSEVLSVVF